MRRLILEEDDFVQDEPIIQDLSSTTLITTLIKNSWDSVDLFNSVLLTLSNNESSEVVDIVKDIVASLYINIGQLESALQKVNSQAEIIDDSKEATDNSDLGNVIVPEEDIEVEMKG